MLVGSRWDGTFDSSRPAIGSCTGDAGNDASEFTPEYRQFLRQFAEIQMGVYENAAGPDGGSAGWVRLTAAIHLSFVDSGIRLALADALFPLSSIALLSLVSTFGR